MPKRQVITPGTVFARLTVLGVGDPKIKPSGAKCSTSRCLCECGNEVVVRDYQIRSGRTKSCGCLRDEVCGVARITHGRSRSPTYDIWMQMRMRCENENNKKWDSYGGRGISVCNRWTASFENFLKDMGDPPTRRHSLERVDNNGNYEPGNVIWANDTTQARNKRNSIALEINGTVKPLIEWCKTYGADYYVVYSRIKQLGWDLETALTTPVNAKVGA